jgi:hypothetical protein
LIDKIGVLGTSNYYPQLNEENSPPVYTTLTTMKYKTPQEIESYCFDISNSIMKKKSAISSKPITSIKKIKAFLIIVRKQLFLV